MAAGDMRAIHRPPSAPKHFCGAKKYTSKPAGSTGRPPAALVASTRISDPGSAPATRRTGIATPVEVSLWVRAYASTPASATGSGWRPGADSITVGVPSHGAAATTVANLA